MSSPKLRVIFRPKSEIQTFFPPKIRWSPKKKKRSSSDFSAEIVTFRLVGGDASPHPPPLNPPLVLNLFITVAHYRFENNPMTLYRKFLRTQRVGFRDFLQHFKQSPKQKGHRVRFFAILKQSRTKKDYRVGVRDFFFFFLRK